MNKQTRNKAYPQEFREQVVKLAQLRRDIRRLRMEREILSKAAAWFARETDSIPSGSSNS